MHWSAESTQSWLVSRDQELRDPRRYWGRLKAIQTRHQEDLRRGTTCAVLAVRGGQMHQVRTVLGKERVLREVRAKTTSRDDDRPLRRKPEPRNYQRRLRDEHCPRLCQKIFSRVWQSKDLSLHNLYRIAHTPQDLLHFVATGMELCEPLEWGNGWGPAAFRTVEPRSSRASIWALLRHRIRIARGSQTAREKKIPSP